MEGTPFGVWKLDQKFVVNLRPWGGVSYELVPVTETPDYDRDSKFDDAGIKTTAAEMKSPNQLRAWYVTFKNTKNTKVVQRFKPRDLFPSDTNMTITYRVSNTNVDGLTTLLANVRADQYLYLELEDQEWINYNFVPAIEEVEEDFGYNITAHLSESVSDQKWGKLSIIFKGAGKEHERFISPHDQWLTPGTKIWHTTMAPINVDQIESIDFTWFKGRYYDQIAGVSFDKIVIEPVYLMDKKVRKDKTIAFLGSSFFLSEMYFNLRHKVDPFDDSITP